ncbi:MAG: sulfatase, partial [Planctomycetes bacterium]|nr:sulfatase [Planctomycetota bacterium]
MPLRNILVGLCVSYTASWVAAAPGPRNIVLMIGDDHGLEVGCYGHPVIRTPSLDRLAALGTRFANGFAAVSSCSASRSTIYTGLYTHANGQYGLAHADHNFASFDRTPSLPTLLGKAGYRTAVLGKLHVKPESVYPFEVWAPGTNPRSTVKMAEAARKFLADAGPKPFLLVVGFTDPHRAGGRGFANEGDYPGVHPARYEPARMVLPPFLPDAPEVRAELAEYCQSVSRMDQGIGAVLTAIEETGHKNDTLVIYLSDNGIPFPGAKTTLYEPGIHLPLLISSPAQAQRGSVCNAMVSWIDIAPTILEWAGVQPTKAMTGRSVLPILDQQDPAGWDTVFASHTFHEVTMYYPVRMVRTRRYKYL